MKDHSTDEVTLLAGIAGLDLGDEAGAVAERLAQLRLFVRELDGISADEAEIDAVFDPAWDERR